MTTTMRHKLGELVVPGTVLLGCLLYWLDVQDARSVARRVPDAVILFTVVLAALVLFRTLIFNRVKPAGSIAAEKKDPAVPKDDVIRRLLFLGVCIGYYAAFTVLGFNTANVLFLLLAYPLAGLGMGWTVVGALLSGATFYGLARLMEFNVPLGPLGF